MERTTRAFVASAGIAVCVALLLVRPALVAGAGSGSLVLVYAAVAGVALAATNTELDGRRLHPAIVLAIGLLAVSLVRTRSGFAVPMHAGAAAIALNTAAAIAEEAFFRRYLYGVLARWGAAVAIGGSALGFALVHLPAYGTQAFAVDLGAGLLLSWQRWTSGSWTVPAATHAAANLLAVIG